MIWELLDGIIFDFDGVFSDNKVMTGTNSNEYVNSSKSDSIALNAFRKMTRSFGKNDFKIICISGEKNLSVSNRCAKLNLPFRIAESDKTSIANEEFDDITKVLYVGNHLNDFRLMVNCGLKWCPSDSHPLIKQLSNKILKTKGRGSCLRSD